MDQVHHIICGLVQPVSNTCSSCPRGSTSNELTGFECAPPFPLLLAPRPPSTPPASPSSSSPEACSPPPPPSPPSSSIAPTWPPSVKTFSLAGLGCSTGTMSIAVASRILRRQVGYTLIVATESTGLNLYFGDNRHMLVTNCIFRAGGTAAALVTSDPTRRGDAKMELVRTVRAHYGADDAAYNAAIQKEDEDGNVGVARTKDLAC